METRTEGRTQPPRAVDLRRGRAPEVEIVACDTFDFLISLRVVLASPDIDFTGYEVGRAWIESARARCAERDPQVLATLGHYLGDGRPTSLHASLISLVSRCPEPRDTPHFLDWLASLPSGELAEVLLDQDGLGADWPEVLAATLASPRNEETQTRLLTRYVEELWPTVAHIVDNPDAVRDQLVDALRVWHEAVYAREIERIQCGWAVGSADGSTRTTWLKRCTSRNACTLPFRSCGRVRTTCIIVSSVPPACIDCVLG